MKPTTIFAVVLVAAGSLYWWNPQAVTPQAPVIEPPNAELQSLVAPITKKLGSSPAEAKLLAAFYFEASETIRRDGLNAKIVKTKSHLRTFCERAATLRFQGAFKKVPGLAAVIHGPEGVIAKVLGLEPFEVDHTKIAEALSLEPGRLDHAKIDRVLSRPDLQPRGLNHAQSAEVLHAIAWACQEAQ